MAQQVAIKFANDENDKIVGKKTSSDNNYANNFTFCIQSQNTLINSQSKQFLGEICLNTEEIDFINKKELRTGVDLICLIDKSYSMNGERMKTVKESLITLLDCQFVTEEVRLQLITFDHNADKLTPLKQLNRENKQQMKEIINSIQIGGSTTIGEATKLAFEQLKQRKEKSDVTSIFLLSDGGDDQAVKALEEQLRGEDMKNEVFTIHTFGYGAGHDENMMRALCNLGKGNYYFVKEINLLDEQFAQALGGLITVAGANISIEAKLFPTSPLQEIQISNTFGDYWATVQNQRSYMINKPYIQGGESCKFKFELALIKFDDQLNCLERYIQVKIMEAKLKISHPRNQEIYEKTAELIITFCNDQKQINTRYGACVVNKDNVTNIEDSQNKVENNQNSFQKAFIAEVKQRKVEQSKQESLSWQPKQKKIQEQILINENSEQLLKFDFWVILVGVWVLSQMINLLS